MTKVTKDDLISVDRLASELGITKAELIKHHQNGDLPIKMHFDHKGNGYFKKLEYVNFVFDGDHNLEEWSDAKVIEPTKN